MRSQPQSSRLATVVLGTAVGALVLLNWHLVQTPVDISPVTPEAARTDAPRQRSAVLATPLDKKPVMQFRETVGRPLFVPDRKPVQRSEPAAKETAAGLGTMRLIGVMKPDNEPGRALIRMAKEANGKWIAEGEQFDGWKLRQVTASSVIVESGGRSHELTLQTLRRPTDEPTEPEAGPQPR